MVDSPLNNSKGWMNSDLIFVQQFSSVIAQNYCIVIHQFDSNELLGVNTFQICEISTYLRWIVIRGMLNMAIRDILIKILRAPPFIEPVPFEKQKLNFCLFQYKISMFRIRFNVSYINYRLLSSLHKQAKLYFNQNWNIMI